jgi:hypothetical protein
LLTPELNDEFICRELCGDSKRKCRLKAEVDVVPKYGCVTPDNRASGDRSAVRVTFEDRKIRVEGCSIEGIGELAESAADARHNTAFTNFPPLHEAPPARRTTDLTPETESPAGLELNSVDRENGPTQILNFSDRQSRICVARISQGCADF